MDAPGTIPRPLVVPAPCSRLEQLLDLQASAEAAVADAERTLKEIKDGIKAEAAQAAQSLVPEGTPLPPVIDIAGTAYRPGLVQRWCTPRRLDSTLLKKDHPGLWEEYARYGKPYWELRPAK